MIPKIQSEPRRFDSWQWFIRSTAEFRSTSTFRLFYRSWFRRKEQAPIIPKTAQNIITYINNQHYETDCTRPSDSAKNEILKRMLINWIHFKKLVKQSSAKQQCLYTCVIDRDILDLVSRFSISNVDWNISSAIRPILIGSMMMAHSPLPWIILILFRWEKQLIYVEINVTFTILLPSSCSAEDCYRWTIDIKKQGDLWTDRPNRSVFTIGKLPKIPGHLELNGWVSQLGTILCKDLNRAENLFKRRILPERLFMLWVGHYWQLELQTISEQMYHKLRKHFVIHLISGLFSTRSRAIENCQFAMLRRCNVFQLNIP